MITVLVKDIEEIQMLKERNIALETVLNEYVKKNLEYRELLEESLGLLDKYQEEVSNLKIRANLWADEVVRLYKEHEDLDKALRIVNKEIVIYELTKSKGEQE